MKWRFVLSEKDFGVLVRGGTLERGNALIALADIGWDRMYFQIERAMRDDGTIDLEEHL